MKSLRHRSAAQQCMYSCGPPNVGATEYHAKGHALCTVQTYHHAVFVLWIVKGSPKGHMFTSDSDRREAAVRAFMEQPKELFAGRLCWPVCQRDSCQNACDDFLSLLQCLHL